MFKNFNQLILAGALLRIILLIYGEYMDSVSEVKYTDIDYMVFTDAARYVTKGESPYLRSTYRYTPLLSWILIPNILLHFSFGKILFSFSDLVCGYLFHRILSLRKVNISTQLKVIGYGWLLNPFVANISTRGNAESLLTLMVVGSLYCFLINRFMLGCILFGLSVHFKIYPIIYALPLLFFIDKHYPRQWSVLKRLGKRTSINNNMDSPNNKTSFVSGVKFWVLTGIDSIAPNFSHFFTQTRLELAIYSGLTFVFLNLLFYSMYGHDFLEHTFLYHVGRKDHRHNFSIWFYPIYLGSHSNFLPDGIISLAAFLPQLVAVVVVGWGFARDIIFAAFLQTFSFVMFNKVCTSQYFMWYIGLLPLILPNLYLPSNLAGYKLLGLWILGQVVWLAPAYFLEFQAFNTFPILYLASLIFLGCNLHILLQVIHYYRFEPIFLEGKLQPISTNLTKKMR